MSFGARELYIIFLGNAVAVASAFDWSSLIPIILPSITTIVLGAVIATLAYLLRSEREHRREIERQVSEKKYDGYMDLMDSFEAMLHGDESQRKDNVARLNDVKRKLIIYGSDDVIKPFQVYLRLATSEDTIKTVTDVSSRKSLNEKFETVIGNVILAIRRDMGNRKTKIKSRDLLYQFDLNIEKTGEDVIPEEN